MLEKVISGGQSGVDAAALRAAKAAGLGTGGWAPAGWATEYGPDPELADFGLEQHQGGYAARTRANVHRADMTLIVVDDAEEPLTGGTSLTKRLAHESGRPWMVVGVGKQGGVEAAVDFIGRVRPGVLNVAGPRESKAPGIGARAEAFLAEVFALLREGKP